MNAQRIQFTGLRVGSPTQATAEVPLRPGLNVITGASDTGKTYISSLIDYMLGASEPPQDNPMSLPYEQTLLGLNLPDRIQKTIYRGFKDGSVKLYDCPMDRVSPTEPFIEVSPVHQTGSTKSLSHFLLSQIGLTGRQVKRNKAGDKSSLTFRHVAHLVIIGEERIISKKSPALSEQFVKQTEERSVFRFFLTGEDDAGSNSGSVNRDERAQLEAEHSLLEKLIEARTQKLATLTTTPAEIDAQMEKINTAIGQASAFVAANQEQIVLLENNRADEWSRLQKAKSRRLYLREQIKRLELLRTFYLSDQARLASILEAGHAFQMITDGTCAVCGSMPASTGTHGLDAFQAGCASELSKIEVLKHDLDRGLEELNTDCDAANRDITRLEEATTTLDREIQTTLHAQNEKGRVELAELLTTKERLGEARGFCVQIAEFSARLAEIEKLTEQAKPAPKQLPATMNADSMVAAFCSEVLATLRKWKFPLLGTVRFDPETWDLVIDDQYRGSFGKGYRALTHAAFTISLMRHCRRQGIPHPGFVLLDTPLNPLRGPDNTNQEVINDEMKRAFFEDLASDTSGDQFIIFENSEPPTTILDNICYLHFSRNVGVGRYGFFPAKR